MTTTKLNIDANGKLDIPLEAVIGEKIAILGVAGSGKTNSAAVVVEELLPHLPMTIVDIEGEYWGLKEKFNLIIIGKSDNVDIEVDASNAAQFATYSVERGVSMILDLSDYDKEQMSEFMLAYFEALWEATFKARRPYEVVLEEAHEWIPQGVRAPLKEILARFSLRGRKRGVGMIIISQRSARVDKDVLTQSRYYLLHRVFHPTDLGVYKEILPLNSRLVEEKVGSLQKGTALVLATNDISVAPIRLRHTYHAGATPELDATQRTQIARADDSMLVELRKLLTAAPDKGDAAKDEKELGEIERLRGLLSAKTGEVTALKAEIVRLQQQIDRLGAENERLKQVAKFPLSPGSPAPQKRAAILTTTPAPPPSRGVIERNEQAQQRLRRRWDAMLRDLRQLQRHKRDLLVYLLEREGESYTVKQLAKALALSESTIAHRPPLDLVSMGLIKRIGLPGRFTYTASARAKLADTFEGMDTEELIAEMIQRLK